jgi:hypothetical protein
MKLCFVTAARNLYRNHTNTEKLNCADKLVIYIDYKTDNDYGLKFNVNPIIALVHPDYIDN